MFMSALLALAILQPASAGPPTSPPAPTPKPAQEDKLVCKRENPIGSRINTRRVCLKQSEWDEIARQAQQDWESSRNDRTIPPNP